LPFKFIHWIAHHTNRSHVGSHAPASHTRHLDHHAPGAWANPAGYGTGRDVGSLHAGGVSCAGLDHPFLAHRAPGLLLAAALDTESEVTVQAAIDALVRERNVIVIAHRLSTIAAADQIVVIDDGRVIERGHHADLLTQQGRYARMWQAQQSARDWHVGMPA